VSARLHLARPGDLDRLVAMAAAFHALEQLDLTDDHRRAAILPLLEGSPHGAIWLIGPQSSPVGYIALGFGWSIELGGMEGFVDEFYIRAGVRGRGMGSEALASILRELSGTGLKALHLEVARANDGAKKLYARHGFAARSAYELMTWTPRDDG
jgi:ribosomal protein S18 acetylase RimI-like enzyme